MTDHRFEEELHLKGISRNSLAIAAFSTVVECPENQALEKMGGTLVCTAITKNEKLIQQLSDNIHIDRLNIGPIPTTKLNWLQPHEGNIIDFLFRNRAYQVA